MNWKYEAIDKLKNYDARKRAAVNILEEIRRLKHKSSSIRSASADGTPVKGGGSGREDMLLSRMVEVAELENRLRAVKWWLSPVERALECLTEEERLVLDRFYIHPMKGSADRLCDELNLERTAIYRRKDDALRHFTIALYGATES